MGGKGQERRPRTMKATKKHTQAPMRRRVLRAGIGRLAVTAVAWVSDEAWDMVMVVVEFSGV
jgi:hypothetical protein